MPTQSRSASVIVPTYREAANIEELTRRLFAATRQAGWTVELLIVDDNSRDGTDQIVGRLSPEFDIRLIVRTQERGLSTAVLEGFKQARHERLAVMDADLQHPPEIMPALLECLDKPECDFAIATRYSGQGEIARDWPLLRKLASRGGTWLARPLGPLSDPMSGCFALTKTRLQQARQLNPLGYKIALELYVKCGCRHPCEVPIQFGARAAGESKANFAVGLRLVQHLLGLYRFRLREAVGGKG